MNIYLYKTKRICMEPGWKFDNVALYSFTPSNIAYKFATQLQTLLPGCTTIYDACACIGGNAIGFAKAGYDVWATEIDSQRYDMLKHNINAEKVNIHHKQGDCFNNFSNIPADIIFIDAPWENGQNYKLIKHFTLDSLVFDNPKYNIKLAFELIKRNPTAKYVILKVPIKFYEHDFQALAWFKYHKHKYCLLDVKQL